MSELIERLAAAGKKCDGHVTHGSIKAQMKVIDEYLSEPWPSESDQRMPDNLGGYPERCVHGWPADKACVSCGRGSK